MSNINDKLVPTAGFVTYGAGLSISVAYPRRPEIIGSIMEPEAQM
jgi:hypothetical protein